VASYRLNDLWEFGATWTYATGQAYTFAGGQYEFYDLDDWSAISYAPRLDYAGRNQYRLPAFHKLDLHATYSFNWLNAAWGLSMNLYNAYNHRNVFSQYIDSETRIDPTTHRAEQAFSVHRISLFPIIPTVGLTCKF
jgi:hypothetical protein